MLELIFLSVRMVSKLDSKLIVKESIVIYSLEFKDELLEFTRNDVQKDCLPDQTLRFQRTRHEYLYLYLVERRFRRNIPPYEIFFIPNGNGINLSVLAIMVDRNNLPTVLYLHGNGGHKMEALQLADHRINLVSFDFSACGKSEGDYVTYGEREAKDVAAVVDELKKRYGIKKIIIWGRSMGASIGIMYASLFPREVSCLVLDSPFRWLKEV